MLKWFFLVMQGYLNLLWSFLSHNPSIQSITKCWLIKNSRMFFVTDTLWSLTWSWIVLSRERCVSACYAEICFLPGSMTEARLSYTSWFLSADILSLSFMPRTSNKYPLGNPEDRNCKNGGSEDSSTEQFLNCCRDCEHFVQCCFHCVPHLQSSSVRGARVTASGRPEISRWGN